MLDDTPGWAASARALFTNIIFLSTVSSLICAQVLKGILYIYNGYQKKREVVKVFVWRTGGMPSSHAAVVSSLCTSIFFLEGLASNLFIFSVCFALVVLRDSMGVRFSTGQLAQGLNHLGKQVSEKAGLDFHSVKEIQGHTPLEVVIGALLGILVAVGLRLFLRLFS
jgi:acid phosphatase family membrane protein YuiD